MYFLIWQIVPTVSIILLKTKCESPCKCFVCAKKKNRKIKKVLHTDFSYNKYSTILIATCGKYNNMPLCLRFRARDTIAFGTKRIADILYDSQRMHAETRELMTGIDEIGSTKDLLDHGSLVEFTIVEF